METEFVIRISGCGTVEQLAESLIEFAERINSLEIPIEDYETPYLSMEIEER